MREHYQSSTIRSTRSHEGMLPSEIDYPRTNVAAQRHHCRAQPASTQWPEPE